jgi:thioredoxin-dependent peroxiredoxin
MEKGDLAPDFELADENGKMRRLSDLLVSGPVVLYFYPAAMTYGCTKESCHFRDLKSDFEALGAQRVGISNDKVEKQKQFSDKHTFDFPLLSDPDGAVASQFGAKRNFGLASTKRMTFVIDTDRKVIDVIKSETRMGVHGDRALEVLRQRKS